MGVFIVNEKLIKERFGRRLALARMKEGLTQKGLAVLLGYKQSEIGFYETGSRMPRDTSIKAICDKLNIDFNWLKYGDEPNITLTEDGDKKELSVVCFTDKIDNDNGLSSKIDELNKEDKKLVSAIVNALILARNPEEMQIKINNEIEDFKKQKKNLASKQKITRTKVNEFSVAEMIADLSELFPDIYQEFITGQITILEADQKVQNIIYEKWPDIKRMIEENCKNDEKHIISNREYVVNNVKPLIRKRMLSEIRKATKKSVKSQS